MKTTIDQSYLRGKTGRIYIARKGTIMVFLLANGESWFANCLSPSNVITKGPVVDYWVHAIDWAGNFSDYFIFVMAVDEEDKPHYPSVKSDHDYLTAKRIEKLKINAEKYSA